MSTIGPLRITEQEVQKRKRYLEITPEDERRLAEAHEALWSQAAAITDRFYAFLLAHDYTRALLSEPGVLERLKELQARYFMQLTSGEYGVEYFADRVKVGQAHYRIGLSPEWYLGAYVKYLHVVGDVLSRTFRRDYDRFFQTMVSLTKIVFLDMGLALDAYYYSAQAELATRNADLEQANDDLRRVEQVKQQFTNLLVHDLQNPVASILAALQILDMEGERLSEDARQLVRGAIRRCNDLAQMIRNVLDISRAEKGQLQPLIEEVDLSRLVRDVAAAHDRAFALENHRLTVETDPDLVVRTDPRLVRRIVENLVRNALRHTPPGTSVVVRATRSSQDSARLSVADDGPGIPVEMQGLLFEPFGAAALRAAGRSVDTGLGLVSCRVAARALGSDIEVQSDGRHGTIFAIELPRA